MRDNTEIIVALLMSLIVEPTHGLSLPPYAGPNGASFSANATVRDTSYNAFGRKDPCISLCERATPAFANSIYVKSCCQRGCRFFNLVDLRYGLEPNSLNGTRDACEASCTEAYTELQDRYACGTGCDFMAKQRVSDLLALFSIAICMEDGIDSNLLLMSPDIPDNDILTDPGLRKELLPRWWDSDGFKLPQTHVKTVPMDAGTVDDALSSDYSGETELAVAMSESDCLHCASEHFRIVPYFAYSLVGLTMIAMLLLWVCMLIGYLKCVKGNTPIKKSSSSTVTLYKVTVYKKSLYSKETPSKYILSPDVDRKF
ncbi:PREDICTED: uncharacterized protein LOC106746958 [Dinoponera quadriceps]|uniref:Uncharacterized protein LOC106746958 n=1 Tax=Dinoponera quadriceps TaxID=609295 RepID=A0A6P3XMF5_DINQU|nr:PREDICTED: uncharacterized protein LOC106746958 [Dinoponera quadriceps]XP_014479641.1 PREDICTED: uncharacterized protein LOC106746958 [Dinoponera quadriceps]